ncbi:hypothetical protein [Halomonas sp. PR-M31]|nr:hypothetical protein [Halomonas sp. PR-M31]
MERIFGAIVYHTRFITAGYSAHRFARADQAGMLSGNPIVTALMVGDAP